MTSSALLVAFTLQRRLINEPHTWNKTAYDYFNAIVYKIRLRQYISSEIYYGSNNVLIINKDTYFHMSLKLGNQSMCKIVIGQHHYFNVTAVLVMISIMCKLTICAFGP